MAIDVNNCNIEYHSNLYPTERFAFQCLPLHPTWDFPPKVHTCPKIFPVTLSDAGAALPGHPAYKHIPCTNHATFRPGHSEL